jgi:hypothetical protein
MSTTNPTWVDSDVNPGLHGEKPVTNWLSLGMTNKNNNDTRKIYFMFQ